jgi:hypothetical protein
MTYPEPKESVSQEEVIGQILNQRGKEYGEAWKLAGIMMGSVAHLFFNMLIYSPQYAHNWVLILSKLVRALTSPRNPDHWKDIAGYATLCLKEIENEIHSC